MAIGQLNGVETGSKLSAHDCFELGRQTYNSGDAANTIRWMNQALKNHDREDKKSVELVLLNYTSLTLLKTLKFCIGFCSLRSTNTLDLPTTLKEI